MNLQENYKRLFKGRIGSNDSKLLKENVNPEVAKAYGVVYSLTDKHGDEPLEVMDQYVDQEGLTDALDKYLDDKKLSPKESKELTAVLNDVAGEFGVNPKNATPTSSGKPVYQRGFNSAFNIKSLKGIKFILPSWDSVDKMFRDGDEFTITFNAEADFAKINNDINKLMRKEKSVDVMDIDKFDNDQGETIVSVKAGNYAGLTYLFAALDKHYDRYGSSIGWG